LKAGMVAEPVVLVSIRLGEQFLGKAVIALTEPGNSAVVRGLVGAYDPVGNVGMAGLFDPARRTCPGARRRAPEDSARNSWSLLTPLSLAWANENSPRWLAAKRPSARRAVLSSKARKHQGCDN
jgi:hypothetical protein